MQITTLRFGDVEIDESKTVVFKDGLPGLEEYSRFVLMQVEDSYPVVWLQSTEAAEICLPVVDSFSVNPEYSFNLDDEDVAELDIKSPEDLHVLSVLVIPENLEGMTMNLAAPIVMNIETGSAKQILLGGGEYSVRHPVFNEICRLIREEAADAGSVKEN